jgi:hypothetical protein
MVFENSIKTKMSDRDSSSKQLGFPVQVVFDLSHFQADKADDSDSTVMTTTLPTERNPVPVVVERPFVVRLALLPRKW